MIGKNIQFEKGQYYQLDLNRMNAGGQAFVALDVILRGIFSKRLQDVITDDKEKIGLFIGVIEASGKINGFGTGTAYLINGDYISASTEYLKGMKDLADLVGHDKMDSLFKSVIGRSGKFIWNKSITTLLETVSLPEKYYLLKEITDNYVTNACPLEGYVQLRAQ